MARVLAPAGLVYGGITAQRMLRPPRYRANIPVICVGNFTVGGTGKTPFVRTLLAVLRAAGHTPVVLSRGYGGTITQPHWIDRSRDTAESVGDEPLLLSAEAPVMVVGDRAAGARAIEHGDGLGLRATVIVMDDGLQNPALAKDLSIAVVDAMRGLGNGRCIPAGPLRAPLAVQMPKVRALVLNIGEGRAPQAPSLDALLHAFAGRVVTARIAVQPPLAWLRERPVLAYSGIGVPTRFFETLANAGADVRETISFPDHHAFTSEDAHAILAKSRSSDLQLVTTEKDAARLLGRVGPLAELALASRTLPIALVLDEPGVQILAKLIADYAPLRA